MSLEEQQQAQTLPVAAEALPDLDNFEEEEIPLNADYWEPRNGQVGDFKQGVLLGFSTRQYPKVDVATGEMSFLNLEVIEFASQYKDKKGVLKYETISNGATLLVDAIKQAVNSGRVLIGKTPIRITYEGIQRTKNGNSMDKFRITVLKPKGA